MSLSQARQLSWWHIVRLGLIQTALGGIVVLTTSTLNRIMVVELALAASLPGFLVTIHHIVQLARPRIGYGSDIGGRRTPWIVGGMFILAIGGVGAAFGTTLIPQNHWLGVGISALGFFAIGVGTGATGTSLLALLAKHVASERKPAAAALVWFMMIIGFAVTAGVAGHFLDPYSPERLLVVTSTVSLLAVLITLLVIRGIEPETPAPLVADVVAWEASPKSPFMTALADVWTDPQARLFTIFVFVSMLAYSAQDLILEPFAGLVFGRTPGESTQLAGVQHAGVLLGMAAMAASTLLFKSRGASLLRLWIRGGCLLSAVALFLLCWGGLTSVTWPLEANVFLLGTANGGFAVAAIGAMMVLASAGQQKREGIRMGLWGAAQAIAFALGGFLGTVAVDLTRYWLDEPAISYGLVFACEGFLFLIAASLARHIHIANWGLSNEPVAPSFGDIALAEAGEGGIR
ncbi:BCD family MFS transporter [Luminiphilus sp.]|nr:BCD family MFS transporter [Luminiphilus sp.]